MNNYFYVNQSVEVLVSRIFKSISLTIIQIDELLN